MTRQPSPVIEQVKQLRELVESTDSTNERLIELKLAAAFCTPETDNTNTIRRWLRGKINPVGPTANRLYHYLHDRGYSVEVLTKLNPLLCYLGRLVAYDALTAREATDLLGLAHESQLWNALRGTNKPLEIEKLGLSDLKEAYENELQNKFDEWLKKADAIRSSMGRKRSPAKLKVNQTLEPEPQPELDPDLVVEPEPMPYPSPVQLAPPLPTTVVTAASQETNSYALRLLAVHLRAALPLALAILGPEFTDDDHSRLRELMGGEEEFFQLSTALNRLSGSRARRHSAVPGEWRP